MMGIEEVERRMEQIQLGDQTIRYDRKQTVRAYAKLKSGGAERCGCDACRNFAAQRSTAYPENFHRLLDLLGIDPEKEGEVYENGVEGPQRTYSGWFYFVGELVEPGERITDAGSKLEYFFVNAKNLPKPKADFGQNPLAIEFTTKLPWVISES
jgi:hypothetical protein